MSATVRPSSRQKALAARLYVDVFGRGDLATADALLAPDAISHGPGTPPVVGAAGIKAQAMILRTAIPDLTVELKDQVEEGDRVTSRWRATGHQTGPLRLPGAIGQSSLSRRLRPRPLCGATSLDDGGGAARL